MKIDRMKYFFIRMLCVMAWYVIILSIWVVIAICIGGCRCAREVSDEVVRQVDRTVNVVRVDSVRDSVWVGMERRNDTVWVEKVKDRFKYVGRCDTVRVMKRDTVRLVVREMGQKREEKGRKVAEGLILGGFVMFVIIKIWKKYGRCR